MSQTRFPLTFAQAYRDITGAAPIDKVAYPGVYITPACFPNNVYDGNVFEACLSDLLSAQYRRLIFDLYWDASNRDFTLCPAELPQYQYPGNATSTAAMTAAVLVSSSSKADSQLEKRQTASDAITTTFSSNTTTSETASTTLSSAISTTTSESGAELLQLGPYQCSDNLNLASLLEILGDYFDYTSRAIQARFHILQVNLHAAAAPDDSNGLPQIPSSAGLPIGDELMGNRFSQSSRGYMYKPSDLEEERDNLNASWLQVSTESRLPVLEYYDIVENAEGKLQTSNGWPSENYLLFNQYKRFMLSYGQIASEMVDYDFRGDDRVFLQNETTLWRNVDTNAAGLVTSGCYYSDTSKSVETVSNSWALTTINQDLRQPSSVLQNLTSCGLGPVLNQTLNDQTAASNYQAYQDVTQGTIFGWASGEPRNSSTVSGSREVMEQFRCVVIDSSDASRGHWRVVNCQQRRRVACRIGGQPFNWRLSPSEVRFGEAPDICQDGTEFGMPRTALENRYLYEHILSDLETQPEKSFRDGVWINLNSLDNTDCWVTSGPNGSCSYQRDEDALRDSQILIPTIAALIVFILTALTILVKCNVNRINSRARRMGPGGWEYEGVPS